MKMELKSKIYEVGFPVRENGRVVKVITRKLVYIIEGPTNNCRIYYQDQQNGSKQLCLGSNVVRRICLENGKVFSVKFNLARKSYSLSEIKK